MELRAELQMRMSKISNTHSGWKEIRVEEKRKTGQWGVRVGVSVIWDREVGRWDVSQGLKEVKDRLLVEVWGSGLLNRDKGDWFCVPLCRPLQGTSSSRTSILDFLKHICTVTGEAWWYQRQTGLGSVCSSWYKKYIGWTSAMNKNIDYIWLEKWPSVRFLFINWEVVCMPGCSRNNQTQFWPQGTHVAPQRYTDKVAYSLGRWPWATRSTEAAIWAEMIRESFTEKTL